MHVFRLKGHRCAMVSLYSEPPNGIHLSIGCYEHDGHRETYTGVSIVGTIPVADLVALLERHGHIQWRQDGDSDLEYHAYDPATREQILV